VSAFGAEMQRSAFGGPVQCCIYARFKGGSIYRYSPAPLSTFKLLCSIAVRANKEEPGISFGSAFHTHVKLLHEGGSAVCEKYDSGTGLWITILTREQKKAIKQGQPLSFESITVPHMRPDTMIVVPQGQQVGHVEPSDEVVVDRPDVVVTASLETEPLDLPPAQEAVEPDAAEMQDAPTSAGQPTKDDWLGDIF